MVVETRSGGILLHEVPGAGDRHQGEILLNQVPGAAERARQQCLVAKSMEFEHGHVTLGSGAAGGELRVLVRARIVGAVVIQHGLEVRSIEGFDIVHARRVVLDPGRQFFRCQSSFPHRVFEN